MRAVEDHLLHSGRIKILVTAWDRDITRAIASCTVWVEAHRLRDHSYFGRLLPLLKSSWGLPNEFWPDVYVTFVEAEVDQESVPAGQVRSAVSDFSSGYKVIVRG